MEDLYYKFGTPVSLSKDDFDAADSCLSSTKYFKTDNVLRFDATLCNNYMVQRCANKWDSKCEQFLIESNDTLKPKIIDGLKPAEFLEEVSRWKFCSLDKNDPNAKCVELCEPINPAAQVSPSVCSIYGTEIYNNNSLLQDIAGDFPATAKLQGYSPVKISKCPIKCNKIENIEENDKVIDLCLTTGRCQDVMMQLAKYVKKNNIEVKNAKFKKYMEYYNSLPKSTIPAMFSNTYKNNPTTEPLMVNNESNNIPQQFYILENKNNGQIKSIEEIERMQQQNGRMPTTYALEDIKDEVEDKTGLSFKHIVMLIIFVLIGLILIKRCKKN